MFGMFLKSIRYVLIFFIFFILSFLLLFVFLFRFKNTNNNVLFGRIFSFLALKTLRIKVEFRGKNILKQNNTSVVIANHQSYFDSIIFGAIIPKNTLIIGKKSLIWFPIFGWIFYLAGNLFVNRKNHQKAMDTMKDVDTAIQNGSSLWIFPEGTRSHGKGLSEFKKGAFYAALQNKVPLQPIVVSTLKNFVDFSKWSPGNVLVEVLEPVSTQTHDVNDIDEIMKEVHHSMKTKIAALDKELNLLIV